MRTLCIYTAHEHGYNVDFFIKHGLIVDPQIDFLFVLNSPTMKLEGVEVINRENIGMDFGAWSHGLLTNDRYKDYDLFVLINSSVRGPFLPVWFQERNWVKLFTDRVTDDVKLVGPTIGWHNYPPHVQSMMLVFDRTALEIGIDGKIFTLEDEKLTYRQTIVQKEVGLSSLILDAGYNIGCMLKALEGYDFRKDRSRKAQVYFWKGSYFGTDVHPYETIFIKDKSYMGCAEQLSAISVISAWTDGLPDLDRYELDWRSYSIAYRLTDRVVDKSTALQNFNDEGLRNLRNIRGAKTIKPYFVVNLSAENWRPPYNVHGLVNQLYALINGIMIGHFTDRLISVRDFCPNYNTNEKLSIGKVFDIGRLNVVLRELGLKTQVGTNGRGYSTVRHRLNIKDVDDIAILKILNDLKEPAIDLDFTWFTQFVKSSRPDIKSMFFELLTRLPFKREFTEVVESLKNRLQLSNYKVIHLRLEDDMIKFRTETSGDKEFGEKQRQSFIGRIKELFSSEDKLFIATDLGKSENRYNNVLEQLLIDYPNARTSKGWREHHPGIPVGRELDAIIDYLICRDGEFFLGDSSSTFSTVLMESFVLKKRPFIDCGDKLIDPLNSPYEILSSRVSHGSLGLNHRLGYVEKINGTFIDSLELDSDIFSISAHAPSMVQIKVKSMFTLAGHCSPTAVRPPQLTFSYNGTLLGKTTTRGEKTVAVALKPGTYTLDIATSDHSYSHSVWLLKIME